MASERVIRRQNSGASSLYFRVSIEVAGSECTHEGPAGCCCCSGRAFVSTLRPGHDPNCSGRLVTVEQLSLRFPDLQEGDLTKIKSAVVSRRTCAQFSREINLGDFMFLGKGMSLRHTHAAGPANLLADVYESVVGAIYLDGGLE